MTFKNISWFYFILCLSGIGELQGQGLPSPDVTGETICGAGTLVLKAQSELDGTPGLLYNWYEGEYGSELIKSIETGTFVTPLLISSKTYYVSISLNEEESNSVPVHANIKNTATILEAPKISLCDSVILHASTTFTEEELENASFQWQLYEAKINGEAKYRNLEDSLSTVGLTYVTKKHGFYRIIVTLEDGCQAISEPVEVTEDNILDPEILGAGNFCFPNLSKPDTLENTTGRSFTEYLWEESLNGTDFYVIGDTTFVKLVNPTPADEDSAVRYYRLTLTEQNCSKTSPVDTVKWYRRPDVKITRLDATDDFFFCETDDPGLRTIQAFSSKGVIFHWQRFYSDEFNKLPPYIYTYSLDFIKHEVKKLDPFNSEHALILRDFNSVASGESITLSKGDWGLYRVIAEDTVTGCINYSNCIFADSAIPLPIVNDSTICTGVDTLVLRPYDKTADTYSWQFAKSESGTFTEIATTKDVALFPPATTGEGWYRLRVTKNGCEDTSDPFRIYESDPPPIPEISPLEDSICPGDRVLFTSSIRNDTCQYHWYSIKHDSVLSRNPEFYALDSGNYYLALTKGFCTVLSDSVKVTFKAVPEANLKIETLEACGPYLLEVKSPNDSTTFQWHYSPNRMSFAALADETSANHLATQKGYYFVEITNNENCSSNSDTIHISGIVTAVIEFPSDTAKICGNASSVVLNCPSNPGNQFLWMYRSDEGTDFAPASGVNNQSAYEAQEEGYYKVEVTDGNCSGTSDSIYVQRSQENASFIAEIIGDDQLCMGSSTIFTSQYTTESSTYSWSYSLNASDYTYFNNKTSGSLELDADFFSSQLSEDSLVAYLRLEVSDSLCSSLSDPFELVVYQLPQVEIRNSITNTTEDIFYCNAAEINFSLSASKKSTNLSLHYQWQLLDVSGNYTDIEGAIQKDYLPTHPGTYRCLSTIKNSECQIASNHIQLKSLPSKIFTSNSQICPGNDIELMVDPEFQSIEMVGEFNYQWYSSFDNSSFEPISNEDQVMLTIPPEFPIYDAGYFFFSAANGNCQIYSDTIEIFKAVIPGYEMQIQNARCEGINNGAITIEGLDPGYSYILNDSLEQTNHSFENLGNGTYKLTLVSPMECEEVTTFNIANTSQLNIQIEAEESQLRGIPFNITATGSGTYHWQPEYYFSDPFTGKTVVTIPENFSQDSVLLVVNGSTSEGCLGYGSIYIKLFDSEEPTFSSFFSPNGDGKNDYFEIIGISGSVGSELIIFDNWGNEIYSTINYQNNSSQSEEINATLKKGIYFYTFKMSGNIYKGSFYVKR